MIVYVEYVLLDNGMLDLLLAYVTCLLCKQRPRFWRVFLSAFVGTALVFPFLYIHPIWARILYKLLVLVAVCIPLSDSLRSLRKNLIVYPLLSCAAGGLYYLVVGLDISPTYGVVHTTGGKLALVAGCALVAVYLVVQVRGVIVEHVKRKNAVKLELQTRQGVQFFSGYYDSGNTATAANGRGILFLSPAMQKDVVAAPTGEDMVVKTIAGKNIVTLYQIETVKIFSGGKVHTIHQVNAAYAKENLSGYDALVPYNL